ncbi:MAG: hypothetical protein WD690_17125 [Vicinamibacterales bacterium]
MPHKNDARLRELISKLERAQTESGDLAHKARRELEDVIRGGALKPVGTSGTTRRKKAGRKKR